MTHPSRALIGAFATVVALGAAPVAVVHADPLTVVIDVNADGRVTDSIEAARLEWEAKLESGSIRREGFTAAQGVNDESEFLDRVPGLFTAPDGKGSLTVDPLTVGELLGPTPAEGRFDTTCQWLETSDQCVARWFEADGEFTIDFGGRYNAFGFFGTDFGDFLGKFQLEMLGGSKIISETIAFGGAGNGALAFVGYFDPDQTFTGARITLTQLNTQAGSDVFGFDDLVIGNAREPTPPLPEPATLALVGTSLIGVAALRRRRKG